MAALAGRDTTLAELASECGVHPTVILCIIGINEVSVESGSADLVDTHTQDPTLRFVIASIDLSGRIPASATT
jgi:hypothetical protein